MARGLGSNSFRQRPAPLLQRLLHPCPDALLEIGIGGRDALDDAGPESGSFLGPPGVGKTHLAISLAIAAAQHGRRVYYGTLADLITSLEEAQAAGQLSHRLKTLTHPALLVVDEIGYLPITRNGAMLFFQLMARRYETASTVLTSNKSFEEWGEIFGDDVMAAALIDRLLHPCHIVNIRGNSYRMRHHSEFWHTLNSPAPADEPTRKPRKRTEASVPLACERQPDLRGLVTEIGTATGACPRKVKAPKAVKPCGAVLCHRAGDRARTGDPQLGKLMLYQLSYSRVAFNVAAPPANSSRRRQAADGR